jgi:hypothetical protein
VDTYKPINKRPSKVIAYILPGSMMQKKEIITISILGACPYNPLSGEAGSFKGGAEKLPASPIGGEPLFRRFCLPGEVCVTDDTLKNNVHGSTFHGILYKVTLKNRYVIMIAGRYT